MDENLRKLRSMGRTLKASIIIGKNGINDEVIKNINARLLKDKLVKIRVLKTFIEDNDKKKISRELAEKTCSQLVDLIGFNIVLAKR